MFSFSREHITQLAVAVLQHLPCCDFLQRGLFQGSLVSRGKLTHLSCLQFPLWATGTDHSRCPGVAAKSASPAAAQVRPGGRKRSGWAWPQVPTAIPRLCCPRPPSWSASLSSLPCSILLFTPEPSSFLNLSHSPFV